MLECCQNFCCTCLEKETELQEANLVNSQKNINPNVSQEANLGNSKNNNINQNYKDNNILSNKENNIDNINNSIKENKQNQNVTTITNINQNSYQTTEIKNQQLFNINKSINNIPDDKIDNTGQENLLSSNNADANKITNNNINTTSNQSNKEENIPIINATNNENTNKIANPNLTNNSEEKENENHINEKDNEKEKEDSINNINNINNKSINSDNNDEEQNNTDEIIDDKSKNTLEGPNKDNMNTNINNNNKKHENNDEIIYECVEELKDTDNDYLTTRALLEKLKEKEKNEIKKIKNKQSWKDIEKTDTHLHNFLTKILIKICDYERSFREKNENTPSKFWKALTETGKFNDVLNRNYNNITVRDNYDYLVKATSISIRTKSDIDKAATTQDVISHVISWKTNVTVQQLLCEKYAPTSVRRRWLEPKRLKLGSGKVINKSTEIMLMLAKVQEAALEIYNKSNKQEKKHAKDILLFFRQVLTTLYRKNIISVFDKRTEWRKGKNSVKNEESRKQHWVQLLSKKQIQIENNLINFNLNEDAEKKEEIEKIELEKLFWKNCAKNDVTPLHYIVNEIKNNLQCIDEQANFKLDDSIMLDEIEK